MVDIKNNQDLIKYIVGIMEESKKSTGDTKLTLSIRKGRLLSVEYKDSHKIDGYENDDFSSIMDNCKYTLEAQTREMNNANSGE